MSQVSCHFYDQLEAWASMKTTVVLTLKNESGEETEWTGKILDFKTKDKQEFLLLKTESQELWVPLETIIKAKAST